MNRRDLLRTSLLASIGAGTAAFPALARDFPPGYDASKELEASDWKPLLLDAHQNETLIALSDIVVPGARQALVNRFLDLLMSAEKAETQREFLSALAFVDGACMERYRSAFVHLPPDQQTDVVALLAFPHTQQTWGEEVASFPGHQHFENLKTWIVGAYYSSPVGLKEIGWDGTFPHGVFSGCPHQNGEHSGPVE
ncbi:MAG: gluconate 2-dehydrogenase subunit 3 family protein [Acidobacteriaceae bacterium]|nr:gluconate 2-dehydrogenase subunit 3 family protein [Acidobacteriaceae bacterium]